ncbi:MAG: ADP-ribosylation factor-like protein [Candidatus Helarchaeota archaeon]
MSEREKFIKKIMSFLKEGIEQPRKIKELKKLPVESIKGVDEYKEFMNKMNIKTIADMASINIEKVKNAAEEFDISPDRIDEWQTIAKIITRAGKYKGEVSKKVMLLGIDNAGKTAITKTLTIKYRGNLQAFGQILQDLLPTKGAVQDQLRVSNVNIILWDLGGQKLYRKIYLREPERFFFDTSAVIYVIDIQDEERFDESLDYLQKIVKIFHFLKESPYFLVLMHKYDPDLELEPRYKIFIEDLSKKVSKILSDAEIEFEIQVSSVYKDITVFNSFSDLVRRFADLDVSNTINTILLNHAKQINVDNLILVDNSGIKLGESVKDPETGKLLYGLTVTNLEELIIRGLDQVFPIDDKFFCATILPLVEKNVILAGLHPDASIKDKLKIPITKDLEPWLENLVR